LPSLPIATAVTGAQTTVPFEFGAARRRGAKRDVLENLAVRPLDHDIDLGRIGAQLDHPAERAVGARIGDIALRQHGAADP